MLSDWEYVFVCEHVSQKGGATNATHVIHVLQIVEVSSHTSFADRIECVFFVLA